MKRRGFSRREAERMIGMRAYTTKTIGNIPAGSEGIIEEAEQFRRIDAASRPLRREWCIRVAWHDIEDPDKVWFNWRDYLSSLHSQVVWQDTGPLVRPGGRWYARLLQYLTGLVPKLRALFPGQASLMHC